MNKWELWIDQAHYLGNSSCPLPSICKWHTVQMIVSNSFNWHQFLLLFQLFCSPDQQYLIYSSWSDYGKLSIFMFVNKIALCCQNWNFLIVLFVCFFFTTKALFFLINTSFFSTLVHLCNIYGDYETHTALCLKWVTFWLSNLINIRLMNVNVVVKIKFR